MILLDTHALLWWQADDGRLSTTATREIAKADVVLVSPVSCWEVAALQYKRRIALDRDVYTWVRDLFHEERVGLAPLTPQAAVGAALLADAGFDGDPADRLLYATARVHGVPLLSKDHTIRTFAKQTGDLRVLW